jgi:hypothetical protein
MPPLGVDGILDDLQRRVMTENTASSIELALRNGDDLCARGGHIALECSVEPSDPSPDQP